LAAEIYKSFWVVTPCAFCGKMPMFWVKMVPYHDSAQYHDPEELDLE